MPARGRWHESFKICAIHNRDGHANRERALLACRKRRVEADGGRRAFGGGLVPAAYPRQTDQSGGTVGSIERCKLPHGPGRDQETPSRCRATVVSGRRRKADHFGTCAMSGTVGPPGSWSDYNRYEVSVTVANPRAVFGRGAIDMMGSIQSIATSAPGRDARRKWFNPGISLAPSRDAAAATAAVRLGRPLV